MLKIKVKVGNITNLSDARYCAGMGVAMLGFPAGPHGIDPQKYLEITNWVSGPAFVLEWTGDDVPENFIDLISSYNVDFIQISAQLLLNVPRLTTPLIVSLSVDEWTSFYPVLQESKEQIALLLLTGQSDGFIDPVLFSQIEKEFAVLLGFGISLKNLNIIAELPNAGIALEAATELKPGLQNYDALADILEGLEIQG